MSWTQIGGPAHSLAMFGNHLAALTPDRQGVFLFDSVSTSWKSIGGPSDALIGGAWDLYALSPGSGDLWRYDGRVWSRAGSSGAQFVGICNSIYCLTPDKSMVFRYDRNSNNWTQVGGAAFSLIGGGSRLYTTDPTNSSVWEYSRYDHDWVWIGGPGAMWVGVQGAIYGLAPDKSGVFQNSGSPGVWTKVGGPAETLIGGGSYLYATQPGTGDLWRYSGRGDAWDWVGAPGAEFVAAGREVYRLAQDRSAVFRYIDESAESQRLRGLLYSVANHPDFGNRVTRGFLVKRQSGEILAEHFSDVCFQPLSTLKLLPYIHAIHEADRSQTSLNALRVSWVQPTSGTPAEIAYSVCLTPGSPGTQSGSATLADALPTMMWESHNRTLDALLARFGPQAITATARRFGLSQTEMYFGCSQPGGPDQPWASNITTLGDLGRIFDAALLYFGEASSEDAFRDNMITLTASPGSSYTSSITGKTIVANNGDLLPIVTREAGVAKAAFIGQFMQNLVLRGKSGSGGPNDQEVGESDVLQVMVPFRDATGAIVIEPFIVAWYVYQRINTVSLEADQAFNLAIATFRQEIHTLPIRLALQTW